MEVVTDALLDLGDLEATPDDGRRWEIIDGAFVVSPAPGLRHQRALKRLLVIIDDAAEAVGLEALMAPFAWRIGPGQIPEPDLIVAAPAALTDRAVEGAPVLVVEVLSSSGRNRDLFEKRRVYANGRAGEYWIVDPDVPSLTVLRLAGDGYDEVAVVAGDDAYETTEPFAVRVVPADIVRPPARG